MPTKNLIGQVFTKLTVLEKTEKRIDGKNCLEMSMRMW